MQQQEKSELSVQPAEETFVGSFKTIVVAQVFQTTPIIQQSMRLVAGMPYHSMFLRKIFRLLWMGRRWTTQNSLS